MFVEPIIPELRKYYDSLEGRYKLDNLRELEYFSELSDVIFEESINYCKLKEDKYDPDKSAMAFFATILKNCYLQRTMALSCYLDPTKQNSIYQNKLNRAKREFKLKQLIS